VFACTHTFHVSCLRKYYIKRFGATPAAREEIERMFVRNPEKLRCVTCNLKSLLEMDEKQNKQRAGVSRAPATTPKPQAVAAPSSESMAFELPFGEQDEPVVVSRPSIAVARNQNKLNRLLETYEKQQGNEAGKLSIKDFKRI
jgi:hypothetical protein